MLLKKVNCCSFFFSSSPLEQSLSSLLLLEQCPEADGEIGGVGVDQDAEAQGDASQTARPRLKKQFVLFMKQQYFWCKVALRIWRHNQQGVPQANRRGSDHTPNQNSFLEAFYQNWTLKKLDQVHKSKIYLRYRWTVLSATVTTYLSNWTTERLCYKPKNI